MNRPVALLFSDLVGSTALLSRIGEDASNDLRRDVFATLRHPVEAAGGTEVKTQGDGLMAAFETVDAALACGLAMLRGVDRLAARDPELPLAIRVGVSAGDAVHEEGDWFGTPVVEAARLCSAAGDGELFVPVRVAEGARRRWSTEPVGDLELKGFPEPVPAVRVVEAPVPRRSGVPMPPELDVSLDPPFLDRAGHRARLVDLVERSAAARATSVVLVSGDAGTGRTRLASEIAQHAADAGATVLHGRSSVGDEPLGPLLGAVRWLALATPPDQLRELLGPHAPVLAALVPAVAQRLDLAGPTTRPDLDACIDAACHALGGAVSTTPRVVVLEDLHDADAATLAALVALADAPGPLTVVATYRPPLGSTGAALRVALDKLDGIPATTGVALSPFDAAGAAHLLAAICADHPVDGGGLATVVAETGGSATRIVEVARRLDSLVAAAAPAGATVEAAVLATCPYKGLEPFEATDAQRYHGRRAMAAELVERVSSNPFTGLVGASGSGKSSLLRAGVLPALDLPAAMLTPGEHPGAALADARRQLGDRPGVLAVDQFEECFTLCDDHDERAAFLDALAAPGPHRVVVALRGDFYGHFAAHPAVARALERSTVLVGPMARGDLEAIVEQPALDVGLTLETGLVELVVNDVLDEPGGLPLLSHAMRETWRRHRGHVLTVADYRSTGGARAAIARSADLAFTTELDADDQQIARAMFLRLTELGDGTADTRRRVALDELTAVGDDPTAAARVLSVLTAARLVTADEHAAEVAHEALIGEWPRLRSWLEEDRDALRAQAHLGQAARDWEAAGRADEDLYAGARLEDASERAARGSFQLTPSEQAFLDASAARRAAVARHDQRARRRLRRLLVAAVVALTVALAAGALAVTQRSEARDQATLADQRRLAAEATAVAVARPDTAALLAVEAARQGDLPEADAALAAALLQYPAVVRNLSVAGERLGLLTTSPDRRTLAASTGSTVVLFDTGSGALLGELDIGSEVTTQAFLSDTELAVATEAEVGRWSTTTQERSDGPIAIPAVTSLALSPDGDRLAVGADDATMRVVDLDGAEVVAPVTVGSGPVVVAWHPDGTHVLTGTGAPRAPTVGTSSVELWDTATGTSRLQVIVSSLAVREVAVDAAGQLALVASDGPGIVTLVDLADGETLPLDDGQQSQASSAMFPAPGQVALVDSAGSIAPFLTTGGLDLSLETGPAVIGSVSASGAPLGVPTADDAQLAPGPDGTVFVTLAAGGVAQVSLDGDGALFRALGDGPVADPGRLSPDGERIAVELGTDGFVVLDRASGGQLSGLLPGRPAAWPRADRVITGDVFSGVVGVVDPTDPATAPVTIATPLDFVTWAQASADGSVALVGNASDAAVVDLDAGSVLRSIPLTADPLATARSAALHPEGRLIAVVTDDGGVEVQDARTGDVVDRPDVGDGVATAPAYDSDGGLLAIGTLGGAVALYDTIREEATATVLRGPNAAISEVSFTARGNVVVSAADDTVRFFDPTGAYLGGALGKTPSTSVAVAADAAALVDTAGHLVVVDLDPDHWPAIAAEWAGRTLTDAEREQFGLDR